MPRPALKRAKPQASRGQKSSIEKPKPSTAARKAKRVVEKPATVKKSEISISMELDPPELDEVESSVIHPTVERYDSRTPESARTKKEQQNVPGGTVSSFNAQSAGFKRPRNSKPGDTSYNRIRHRSVTPSFESSILSTFRPRARQPSILQLMDDGSSDLHSSELGDASELVDEDLPGDFDLDDVSTPLPTSKRKTIRPSDILTESAHSTPVTSKHPRVTVEIIVKRPKELPEPLPQPIQSDVVVNEDEDNISNNSDSDLDSLPSMVLPDPQPRISKRRKITPPRTPPRIQRIENRSPTPPMSTPQYIRHTTQPPDSKRKTTKSDSPNLQALSTTALQAALLPKRSTRRYDKNKRGAKSKRYVAPALGSEDELAHSSTEDEEEDVSLFDGAKAGKSTGGKRSRRRQEPKTRKPMKNSASNLKTKPLATTKSSKASKTYSRPAQRDAMMGKENLLDLPQPGKDQERDTINQELAFQKQKFAEIDQWSIDFEEVELE